MPRSHHRRNRAGYPHHRRASGQGRQRRCPGQKAGLVSLTAGGNDVGFGAIMAACAADTTPQATGCQAATAQGLAAAAHVDVGGTVEAIKKPAENARIVWLGYPHLFATASQPTTTGGGVMSPAAAAVFDEGTDRLNAVLSGKAQEAGAQFVDVSSKFEGHEIGSSDSWFNLGPFAAFNFHPTATGYSDGYYPANGQRDQAGPARDEVASKRGQRP